MRAIDTELTASQVLRVFHHDELYLFLGAAFVTVGLMLPGPWSRKVAYALCGAMGCLFLVVGQFAFCVF